MREHLTARICLKGLDARKFSCAKIPTITVLRGACKAICPKTGTASILVLRHTLHLHDHGFGKLGQCE